MGKSFNQIMLALFLIFLTTGCSIDTASRNEVEQEKDGRISTLELENEYLKEKISSLELDKAQLESKLKDLNELSLLDSSYEQEKRLVPKKSEIRPLPVWSINPYREIQINSVVDVIDSVDSKGERWLYVSIPVYDTPINNKGWIPKVETVPLTKDNVKLVQSDVTLKEGTTIYNVEFFDQIPTAIPVIIAYDVRGRIMRRQNSYVNIASPGGWYFWVDEKQIVYPKVEK